MDAVQAITIAIVEGITEFLPISSTGHMIVVANFLGIAQDDVQTSFETIIQLAAILAVVVYYRDRLTLFSTLWQQLLVAFLPIAVVGFLFADGIKTLFSVVVVAWAFIVGGVIFLLVEKLYVRREVQESDSHTHSIAQVSVKNALVVGIAQVASLVPGTSRAGATIIGGMLGGLSRKQATEFSFLLAVPVMGAVAFYDGVKHAHEILAGNLALFTIGFVTVFVVAYITIVGLVRFIARFSFVPFGWYRIIFGVLLLFFFL